MKLRDTKLDGSEEHYIRDNKIEFLAGLLVIIPVALVIGLVVAAYLLYIYLLIK